MIASGGNKASPERPCAAAIEQILQAAGVPASRIIREDVSTNTYENALFTARILRKMGISRIVLVLEADSMLRADLCFRKLGISVAPAVFDESSLSFHVTELAPKWSALQRTERALHEYGGLLWYKVRGWI